MPLYHYEALDSLGKKKSGEIDGENEKDVKEKLRSQGVMLTLIREKKGINSKQNLKGDALLAFTIQLSQLISAGVPLYESLMTMEEQYRGEKFHRVILRLCEQIKSGKAFSDSMAEFPQSFDKLYRAMVKAGESSGTLDLVLSRLSEFLQKKNKLRRQLMTAMIYPAILGTFSLLIIGLLIGFVVPSIEGIFEDRELNDFTQFILNISHFLQDYWWVYIPLFLGAVGYLYYILKSEKGKIWLQKNLIKLPLIKKLIIQTGIARFTRTMGTLQSGGLTMIESLRIGRDVIGNVVLEDEIKAAEDKIIEGSSMSHEFNKSKLIPKMVSRMLLVGEDTGNTQLIFNKIAEIYEDEVEKSLDRIVNLAQPVILIFMGSIIGMVMLAILLPLTDVSSFSF